MIDPSARGIKGCLCCKGIALESENSIVSPYLAFKAFEESPSFCRLYHCPTCDFRFYDRGLTEAEGNAYYRGYRDEKYFVERNSYEPFYTRAAHDGLTVRLGSEQRGRMLAQILAAQNLTTKFDCVVDYGGGDGSLIAEIPSLRRISFDPSGNAGRPGVEIIEDRESLPEKVDLVTCAQVLEHVSDPGALLDDMVALLSLNGLLYLEVPDQLWQGTPPRLSKSVAERLCRHPRLLLIADIYSTAFRVLLGVLPPFGFVPMREHINFFSEKAVRAFAKRPDLRIRREGRAADKSFYLIAQKIEPGQP
jgi:hypothetical protein